VIPPFTVLAEDEDLPRWDVPTGLAAIYGSAIGFEQPCVVANFVESLDGVVAVPGLPRSHALIGDESEADRFLMALLRASADAVVIGSGTLLSSPKGTWRADRVYPPAAEALAELRVRRGLPEQPLVAVVTAGGSFDPSHQVLESGVLVLTTEQAAADLRASVPEASEVLSVNDGDSVDLAAAMAVLRDRGCAVILSEAGPSLFAELLASRQVDELFLTLSPVVAGRGTSARLGLVEGVELLPETRVAGRLRSVRAHGSHLFLRYRLAPGEELRCSPGG
jgi:riboflavin biosynthesis pyrimidine reductase